MSIPSWPCLAVVVGLAGGFGAVGFRYLINFFQNLAYGSSEELLNVVRGTSLVPESLGSGCGRSGGRPAGVFFCQRGQGSRRARSDGSRCLEGRCYQKKGCFCKNPGLGHQYQHRWFRRPRRSHCSNRIRHRFNPRADAQGFPGPHADPGRMRGGRRYCRHFQCPHCRLNVCAGGCSGRIRSGHLQPDRDLFGGGHRCVACFSRRYPGFYCPGL